MNWEVLNTANAAARQAGLDLLRLRQDYPGWRITWRGGTTWRAVRGGVELIADSAAEIRGLLDDELS